MGRINIESDNEELLNEILLSVGEHFNGEQNNFKLKTEGFEVTE